MEVPTRRTVPQQLGIMLLVMAVGGIACGINAMIFVMTMMGLGMRGERAVGVELFVNLGIMFALVAGVFAVAYVLIKKILNLL